MDGYVWNKVCCVYSNTVLNRVVWSVRLRYKYDNDMAVGCPCCVHGMRTVRVF